MFQSTKFVTYITGRLICNALRPHREKNTIDLTESLLDHRQANFSVGCKKKKKEGKSLIAALKKSH